MLGIVHAFLFWLSCMGVCIFPFDMDGHFQYPPGLRRASFVWSGMEKHVVIDPDTVMFYGDHIYIVGHYDGDLPETCVSGSGHYECHHRYGTFLMYLCYLEYDDGIFKCYIDRKRSAAAQYGLTSA